MKTTKPRKLLTLADRPPVALSIVPPPPELAVTSPSLTQVVREVMQEALRCELTEELSFFLEPGTKATWSFHVQRKGFAALIATDPLEYGDLLAKNKICPILALLDKDGALHSLEAPALVAPFFGINRWYGWGVVISRDIANGDVDAILAAENSEARAIGVRIVGFDKIASAAKWTTFDVSPGKINVGAMRALVGNSKERFFVCTDGSSSRTFCIPVPIETKTADEAAEWVNGVPDSFLQFES